jgi:hypothetical protein
MSKRECFALLCLSRHLAKKAIRRFLILSVMVGGLSDCSGPVTLDEALHIVGVVISSTSASTPVERPGPFTLVGAAGGLVGTRAKASVDEETHIHNRLYVRTAWGELTVDTDQYFPTGSCVEIKPFAGERSGTFFPYGSAQLARSDHC